MKYFRTCTECGFEEEIEDNLAFWFVVEEHGKYTTCCNCGNKDCFRVRALLGKVNYELMRSERNTVYYIAMEEAVEVK